MHSLKLSGRSEAPEHPDVVLATASACENLTKSEPHPPRIKCGRPGYGFGDIGRQKGYLHYPPHISAMDTCASPKL